MDKDRTNTRTITIYGRQADKIDEAKRGKFNLSKFVRDMIDNNLESYLEK